MTSAPTNSRALAPAKLNLYLDVLGRRADGFHDLETIFVALDLGDEVGVRWAPGAEPGVDLHVQGDPSIPTDGSNLAFRAAQAFLDASGATGRVTVTLEKRVPAGQGLGGGSSDAASVLGQLDRLLPEGVAPEQLDAIALELGSDVPFFVYSYRTEGAAVGRGRGERLEALVPLPSFEAVLVLPPIHCTTAVVYRNLGARIRSAPAGGLKAAISALEAGDPARMRQAHYNALAVPAISAYPALARFTSDVERRLGRPPCLTGSGAALFDLPDPGETGHVLAVLDGLPGRREVVHFGSESA